MLLKKYLLKRLMQTKYLVLVFIYYLIEIIIYDELYCIIQYSIILYYPYYTWIHIKIIF